MAVFLYEATKTTGEEFTETDTIEAQDTEEARAKLNMSGFSQVRLERIRWYALWKRFSADVK